MTGFQPRGIKGESKVVGHYVVPTAPPHPQCHGISRVGVGGCSPEGITQRVGKAGFGDTRHISTLHMSEHSRGHYSSGLAVRRDGGKGEEVRERGTDKKGGRGRSGRTRKGEMKGERKRDLKEVDLQWDVPKSGQQLTTPLWA